MKTHTHPLRGFAPIMAAVLALMTAAPVTAKPSAPDVQQLQADFRKLGFGMFIHYNIAKEFLGQCPRLRY